MRPRFWHFAFAMLTAVSLMAASVSACACEHHETFRKDHVPSCHEHQAADQPAAETANAADTAACSCVEPAPKASSKADSLKFKKHFHAAAGPLSISSHVEMQPAAVPAESAVPAFVSAGSQAAKPTRGPPRS